MVLPRADIAGTRPTATIEPPTPVATGASARQETFNRLAQIMLGRQFQAEVLSRFDDGTYLVRVADTPARMALPDGAKVGDNLSMTMLAHDPRPTFLLNAEPGSAKATLSSAGRLVDTILQIAQRSGADTAITAKEPVLSSPALLAADGTAPQIAKAMQDALSFSGLFYESHLHEWINGTRSTTDVMREPQAGMQAAGEPAQRPHAATDASSLPAALETKLAELLSSAQLIAANPAVTDADTMLSQPGKSDASAVESLQLLPLQLHALEQRQVAWHGELFPGLPMEWSVGDDTPRRDAGSNEPQQWQSAVRFTLPSLGAVSASIQLVGDRVQIQVRAASEDTAAALRASGQDLADALSAAGSPLDSLLIKQDEQA
jgi:hypothetical protein